MEHSIKRQNRRSGVGASPAQTRAVRYPLFQMDADASERSPAQIAHRVISLCDKILRADGDGWVADAQNAAAIRLFKEQLIAQPDRLKKRVEFVIPIRTFVKDIQIKVNFCSRQNSHN